MSEVIQLPVKAKHFKDAPYRDNCNCPLANAAKEKFNAKYVQEGVDRMQIDNIQYNHNEYGDQYRNDYINAELAGFDDTIIRTITLTSTT